MRKLASLGKLGKSAARFCAAILFAVGKMNPSDCNIRTHADKSIAPYGFTLDKRTGKLFPATKMEQIAALKAISRNSDRDETETE